MQQQITATHKPHEEVHVHEHLPAVIRKSAPEVTEDLTARATSTSPAYRRALLVSGVLLALGIVGVVMRIAGGYDNPAAWGYYAATVAFLLITVQSAPMVSIATRMVKAHWRRPIARASELFLFAGILNFLLFLPLLGTVPAAEGRNSMWMGWRLFAPHGYDTAAFLGLVLCGLGLLVTAAIPDWARTRDNLSGFRAKVAHRFSRTWMGDPRQWNVLVRGLGVLGGLYFLALVWAHSFLSMDFMIALVPGWKDSIQPAQHALVGLQSGVALMIVTLYVMRRWGGYHEYVHVDQFWGLAKLLLALSLLWFYFWWSQFIIFWYGRLPSERSILELIMFGPYLWAFVIAFAFSFVVPFLILVLNSLRKSILGPTVAACFVLVGALFNVIRLYVGPYQVSDFTSHAIQQVPATRLPDLADILVFIGAIGGAVFFYLVAFKLFGGVSQWEVREYLTLRRVRRFLKTHVLVLAKSD